MSRVTDAMVKIDCFDKDLELFSFPQNETNLFICKTKQRNGEYRKISTTNLEKLELQKFRISPESAADCHTLIINRYGLTKRSIEPTVRKNVLQLAAFSIKRTKSVDLCVHIYKALLRFESLKTCLSSSSHQLSNFIFYSIRIFLLKDL